MERRVVAFAGLSSKFVEQIRKQVQATGADIAVVKFASNEPHEHLTLLAKRLLDVIATRVSTGTTSVYALLVSAFSEPSLVGLEREIFFPAVRRLQVMKSVELSHAGGLHVVDSVRSAFEVWKSNAVPRLVRASADTAALLPVRNARSNHLNAALQRVWAFEAETLGHNIDKQISRRRRGRGLYTRGLQFQGRVNSNQHPVRRCTDSIACDLKARLRLGHLVPPRFEFDVTCETGLGGKTFFLCGGGREKIAGDVSHLNMRINDDFKAGND